MIEKALKGSSLYWTWICVLLGIMGIGAFCYVQQYNYGLGYTGMSRDVSWGLYISQFTFLVGVAAGGVMVVLPYYIHDYKTFGRITILGEFLAIASVAMCLMFIMADLGQPLRALNVLLHPTLNSMLFWDMIVLNGYLALNIIVGTVVLQAEYKGTSPPAWYKPFAYLSIPWAISIHTVTAFLYCGLPGRHFWLTAILAPRFLASAFAAGPALLLFIALILKRTTKFDIGKEAQNKLVTIITYAAILNFFFLGLEFFVGYYSNLPGHMHTLDYLFWGLHGYDQLVPFMRFSLFLGAVALVVLFTPQLKKNDKTLGVGLVCLFFALWIDKGLGLVLGGFVPNPLEYVTEYTPSLGEMCITLAVWATGFLILTLLYKIAISVKLEKELP
ncbi:MAG: polysulfide reductase NrfD [Desulfobulbaceae bacterium]|nr:polysulfide reductase NrfD [Desulfobulbaceae bacterium]MCK5340286.1 polysulfide reductase NrfD [Desulfobulbaceae bacterium]MCK5403682.1 polysulfide reductase NrfD [Desulfobulbaceae bacterium]